MDCGLSSEAATLDREESGSRQAMAMMPTPARCCAVVVSYKPLPALVDNLRAVSPQLEQIWVIDNGSLPESFRTLHQAEQIENCTVIRLDSNRGVAGALNVGVQCALKKGFVWIFTFDQDSRVTAGYVESMLRDYEAADRNADVGMVAPRFIDGELGLRYESPRLPSGDALEVITAGAMVSARVFRELGMFDESLFIDLVDTEFSLRCRKHQYRLISSQSSLLIHSIGSMGPYRLGKRTYYPSNHSPARRYYIARNRTYLMLRNPRDWRWIARHQRAAIVEFIKVVVMESDRRSKLWGMTCGVFDGVIGAWGSNGNCESG